MTLLRASSDAVGLDVDLAAATGDVEGGGVPDGATLVAFTEAAVRADGDELAARRRDLVDAVGPAAAAHAAATVSAFSGLVRVADAIGIPIDDGLAAVSTEHRDELGLERYGGAANSAAVEVDADRFSSIDDLFGPRVRT
ncbi:MAG: hypothetical protein AAGA93_13800 [Actinomycetota bacterium]